MIKDTQRGTSKARPDPWNGTTTVSVPIANILIWKRNPRRFRKGLKELGTEMKRDGQLEPLIGRRCKDDPSMVEIADGTRRRQAAELAGIAELRVEIRTMTDREMVDIGLTANDGQHLHPLEEAEAYRCLVEEYSVTVDEVAARHGIPVARVHGRLRLCALTEAPAKAFEAGYLTAGGALQLARLAGPVQASVWAQLERRAANDKLIEITESTVRSQLDGTILLPMVDAPFELRDKTLVPKAGACEQCPKRTNNQRHLFEVPDNEADACTDHTCWIEKRSAQTERLRKRSQERGREVLEGPKVKGIFMKGAPQFLEQGCGFIELDKPSGHLIVADEPQSLQRLVGKGAAEHAILAIDPVGNPRQLVPVATAKKLLREVGKGELARKIPDPTEVRRKEQEQRDAVAQAKLEAKERREAAAAGLELVHELATAAKQIPRGFWPWLAGVMIAMASPDAVARMWQRLTPVTRGSPPRQVQEQELTAIAAKGDPPSRAIVVELAASRGAFSPEPEEGGIYALDGALQLFAGMKFETFRKQHRRAKAKASKVRTKKAA